MYKYTRKQIAEALTGRVGFSISGDDLWNLKAMLLEKKQWKPKEGERYYLVNILNRYYYGGAIVWNNSYGGAIVWNNSEHDQHWYKHGLVFPYTKEGKKAAIKRAKEMLGINN